MAFPTTITTDGLATLGCAGPFVSSTGNVYVIIIDDQQYDLRALKATDPSSSFAGAGTDVVVGSGTDFIKSVAGHQVGDVIHILSKNGDGSALIDIRYHVFDMSSDTWTTTNTMVKANMDTAVSEPGYQSQIDITVRADGAIIAIYNGAYEIVSTVQYDRVYYARNVAGAWSTDFALGTAGVAASFIGGKCINGSNNNVHFFFQDATNSNAYQRTIDSAYAMQALGSPFDTGIFGWGTLELRGAFHTASGVVSMPYFDVSNTLSRAKFTSTATPVVVLDTDITSPTLILNAPERFVASMAIDGNDLWNVFISNGNDLYTQFNVAESTWDTPFLFGGAVSASAVYTNIYTRGAYRVIGIVYHDTDPKYNEFTLSVSSAASLSLPNGFLLGKCGR